MAVFDRKAVFAKAHRHHRRAVQAARQEGLQRLRGGQDRRLTGAEVSHGGDCAHWSVGARKCGTGAVHLARRNIESAHALAPMPMPILLTSVRQCCIARLLALTPDASQHILR